MKRATPRMIVGALACAAMAQACGGARVASPSSAPPQRDAVRATAPAHVGDAPTVLGDRVDVPGTGVSMQPPAGASLMRIGAGFLGAARELDIFVAIGEDEATLEEIASLGADALHPRAENVMIDGRAAQLFTDGYVESGETVERVWFFVRDGARGLAVLGEYDAGASATVRAQVRESLLSTRWDASVVLDPERAAGYRIGAAADLSLRSEVVNGLSYTSRRHTPRGQDVIDGGQPAILVAPLDVSVPLAERRDECELLLMLAGPVGAETVIRYDEFETEGALGCEVFGEEAMDAPRDGGAARLATYAAIVFLDEDAFVVAGVVDATDAARWTSRFGAAARSLAWVARTSPSP